MTLIKRRRLEACEQGCVSQTSRCPNSNVILCRCGPREVQAMAIICLGACLQDSAKTDETQAFIVDRLVCLRRVYASNAIDCGIEELYESICIVSKVWNSFLQDNTRGTREACIPRTRHIRKHSCVLVGQMIARYMTLLKRQEPSLAPNAPFPEIVLLSCVKTLRSENSLPLDELLCAREILQTVQRDRAFLLDREKVTIATTSAEQGALKSLSLQTSQCKLFLAKVKVMCLPPNDKAWQCDISYIANRLLSCQVQDSKYCHGQTELLECLVVVLESCSSLNEQATLEIRGLLSNFEVLAFYPEALNNLLRVCEKLIDRHPHVLDKKHRSMLLDNLEYVIESSCDRFESMKMATTLCLAIIVRYDDDPCRLDRLKNKTTICEACQALLSTCSGDDPVFANLVVRFLQAVAEQRRGIDLFESYPGIFSYLADAVANDPSGTTCTLDQSFAYVVNKLVLNEKNLGVIPRTPRMLEAIIRSANVNETTRTTCLTILLRLIDLSSNRRILAKHPGFLSLMIRAVRSWPNSIWDAQNVSRETVKGKIQKLATAL